ncbi:MAG: Rieske 2Fe-2S domain-containing protein [Chloroflexi bacterium]|nr:Rieske 2Fe-2S domain-containing protein [Chloroflexota bacterium]
MSNQTQKRCNHTSSGISRRNFLKLSGGALVVLTLPAILRKPGFANTLRAQRVEYPRQVIGKLSELKPGQPIFFNYPWDHPSAENFLVILPEPAGGGVGPDQNVVAFNSYCTHLGEGLQDTILDHEGIAGPCPYHLTTFDLNRHGMVISGHAAQSLPQITLEADGDDIVATGVLGLVYGFYDNRVDPNA